MKVLNKIALVCLALALFVTHPARAQAQITSPSTINGRYSCTGMGWINFGGHALPFAASGMLESNDGATFYQPPGTGWAFVVAGTAATNIAVTSGDYEFSENGQGSVTLTFSGALGAFGTTFGIPEDYQIQVNSMVPNASSGTAQEFTLTATPAEGPQNQLDVTIINDCKHLGGTL